MTGRTLLHPILDDEALTRRLGDAEARVLVEWLVDQAEFLARDATPEAAEREVGRLCRRGRAIARFVSLWCHERAPGAAGQLAAVERFAWPLPRPGPAAPERRRGVPTPPNRPPSAGKAGLIARPTPRYNRSFRRWRAARRQPAGPGPPAG